MSVVNNECFDCVVLQDGESIAGDCNDATGLPEKWLLKGACSLCCVQINVVKLHTTHCKSHRPLLPVF